MAAPTLRTITDDEFGEWFNTGRMAMLGTPLDEDALKERRPHFDLDRCIASVGADGKLCGTAAAFATELTVPDGSVSAAAVTLVGVLPTHRRQGHLTRMMQSQLDDVAERGEPIAALVAAEYPIYGRYGYGPATEGCAVDIDAASLAGLTGDGWSSAPSGRVELVSNETFASALPDVYDRARQRFAGHIAWREHEYRVIAGLVRATFGGDEGASSFKALWYDETGTAGGAVTYTVEQNWEANRPRGKLSAFPLVAATDEAERELVRYLTAVDWVATIRLGLRPTDDPVPLWLRDGRAATLIDRSDHLWVRVVDVPAALGARRYQAPGSVVIQVDDPMGYAGGRFLLEVTADDGAEPPGAGGYPATCTPTDAGPDLFVPVHALGAAYLGGLSWSRLAAAGWVDEESPGSVASASAMFSTPRAPWCAMTF